MNPKYGQYRGPLCRAPTILRRWYPKNGNFLEQAAAKVRREFDAGTPDGKILRKLAPDIWAIDKPLPLHTDKTAAGHYVFGVVLLNDPGCVLIADGIVYDLPVGTVYTLDGHRRHGALAHNQVKPGLLAFMAWDVKRDTDVQELLDEAGPSLLAWVNGEERVDIS